MVTSYKKANGLYVVSRKEGAIVGRLDDFQFDLERWNLYGYRIKGKGSGVFARAGGVRADCLDHIGRDVAFINSEDEVEWSASARQPEDGRAWASQYRGTRVIGRNGVSVGTVDDLVFAPGRGLVALVLDGQRMVELDDQVRTGPAAIVLADPEDVKDMTEEQPAGEESWWSWLTRSPRAGGDKPGGDKPGGDKPQGE